ncbi:MAG: four helix bundle protein [Verrucomicrobiae bacterium]|nr:four helix bundle protein [Verrucomicrobiae bacterium]
MTSDALKGRTKKFALEIFRIAEALPRNVTGKAISSPIAGSGSSMAANYRAACKARSRPEFIAKSGIAEEEADETLFWMEMLMEAGLTEREVLASMHAEGQGLTSILAASRISATRNLKNKQ